MKMYANFKVAVSPDIDLTDVKELWTTIDCLIFSTKSGRFRVSDEMEIDSSKETSSDGRLVEFSQRYKGIGVSDADEDHDIETVKFDNGVGLLNFMKDESLELEEIEIYTSSFNECDEELDLDSNVHMKELLNLTFVDYNLETGEDIEYNLSEEQIKQFNKTIV